VNLIKITIISTGDNIFVHGIRSISSYLKEHGYNTRLIFLGKDIRNYSQKALIELENLVSDSDIIGISCTSYTSDKAIQVIDHIKNNLEIPIVWGGIHATFNPEECLKYADFVCIGEGEEAMLELVEKLEKKEDLTNIKNIWAKKSGKIYKNDVRPLFQNLDNLPFDDYDLEDQWILDGNKIVKLSERHFADKFNKIGITKLKFAFKTSRFLLLHTSRGCPHQCSFCCNYNLRKLYHNKGNYIRKRSIKHVIKQLQELKQKFPDTDFIWFTDDSFFIRSVEELKLFSKEYKEKIGIRFMVYVDPVTFSEEKLKILLDAGLKRIEMGVQTGSEEVNKNIYNRNIKNEQIMKIAKILNKYKHRMSPPEYQIIIANPYETEEDILATIKLLQELPKPFYLQAFAMVFFPGTALYHRAKNDGMIKSKVDTCYNVHYVSYTKNLTIKSKKLNNLYLNLLLIWMDGTATNLTYGYLTKRLLNLLVHRKVINFFNKFEFLTKILIKITPKDKLFKFPLYIIYSIIINFCYR